MVLAGDIGGTKTNLALFEPEGARLRLVRFESYASRDHASLDEIVAKFTGRERPPLEAAGFGVAGPVVGGRVRTTNLPWLVDGARLAAQLGLATVSLVNDVEAHAWSIERLGAGELVPLQEGVTAPGNVAVVAAGTGLGFSALVRSGRATVALASEGGHADFAPRNELEVALLGALRARYGHVSAERVLSGPGLLAIYEFLRDGGRGEEPPWLAAALAAGDPPAEIARAAVEGRSPLCEQAVETFVGIYGGEAGNWALRTLATGGVYLGGGIAAKLFCGRAPNEPASAQRWRARAREIFLGRFLDKGRMRPLLEAMPVRVIADEKAPLLGAAHHALAAGKESPCSSE